MAFHYVCSSYRGFGFEALRTSSLAGSTAEFGWPYSGNNDNGCVTNICVWHLLAAVTADVFRTLFIFMTLYLFLSLLIWLLFAVAVDRRSNDIACNTEGDMLTGGVVGGSIAVVQLSLRSSKTDRGWLPRSAASIPCLIGLLLLPKWAGR